MPLSEFYGMARGKVESAQQKTNPFSTDQSHGLDDEFVELVWENGQIMMQGQSSRSRRIPFSNTFQSQTTKLRDRDLGSFINSKTAKFGAMDCALNEFATAVPSGEIGLGQDDDDDGVPWWNYPIVDSLQHDYCSELLPELSGVTENEISGQNSFSPIDKRNNCNQTSRGTNSVSVYNGLSLEQANSSNVSSSEIGESSRTRTGQFYPWSLQESQTSPPSHRSGVSGIITTNTSSTKGDGCRDSIQAQASTNGLSNIKIQKQDSGPPKTSCSFMNFSHFSRPAALVRANLQNVGPMGGENNGTAPSTSNLAEPLLIDLSSSLRNEMGSPSQPKPVPTKVDSRHVVAKPLEDPHTAEQSLAVCREDIGKNSMLPNQVVAASASKGMPDGKKTIDPVVACSSVGSGNSADRASNDPMQNLKRKYGETDDSEGRSEDVEEESVGVRKAAAARGGAGSKRSRAAEVHNLSERRRRDRINEKMRALQELIPNCNKVDKASMLDEAIEYLKTLQLQVQIMSMGAGLYMPPMMLPTGMQHVHAAHMAHFSPMAVGMGMGMGFGMGMNGGAPGCPMIQVPSMHGPHFSAPCPQPIVGPSNFQGMAGSNLQVFGHPVQGHAVSAPRANLASLAGRPPVNPSMGLNANVSDAPVDVLNSAPSSKSKDLMHNSNSQMMHNTDASSSMDQKSSQCHATNGAFEQPTSVPKDDQAANIGCGEDVSLTKENDNST